MPKRLACALWVLLLAPMPAGAAPVRYVLAPGTVHVSFRGYGLGMLPIDGEFSRFDGTLTLDSQDPAFCAITLRADTASLAMGTAAITADAQGPDLMDVTRFPELRLNGSCDGKRLQATLLLHGVSRPLPMDVVAGNGTWQATALMRRADWGMGARPMLAGPEARVRITAGLPQVKTGATP